MRLICGIVRFDAGPPPAAALNRMITALRPLDHAAVVQARTTDNAAFAVLDCDGSSVPPPGVLPVACDGSWFAADLRLDRPADVAAALGLPPHSSPHVVALAALTRFGGAFPDRVDGDYAVATWNPSQQRLLCTRDIMGARPLCYATEAGHWCAFASTPRALLASGLVAPTPDCVALGTVLVAGYLHGAQSEYEQIAWLPAGHSLEVTSERTSVTRAWAPQVDAVGTWRGTAADAASTLRALIEDGVARRLPSSGAVAADLSGGLDSSAVSVIAARQLRARGQVLYAFSQLPRATPGVDLVDERGFVDAVRAQEPDIRWAAIHPSDGSATAADADGLSTWMADPTPATCVAAAAAGARVLLTGSGGDEAAAFNGAGLHAALARQGYWRRLPRELAQWAARRDDTRVRATLDRVVYPLLADATRVLRQHEEPGALLLLAPRVRTAVRDMLTTHPVLRNRHADRIWCLTSSYLASRATRWATTGARHGVAFTHPLSDRKVLDFALSLPLDHLVRDGWTRQPFRNAMAGILPEPIRWRESKFAPYPDAALRFAAAKPALCAAAAALRDKDAVRGFVDVEALEAWLQAIPEGPAARAAAEAANRDAPRTGVVRRAAIAVRALDFARFVDAQSR